MSRKNLTPPNTIRNAKLDLRANHGKRCRIQIHQWIDLVKGNCFFFIWYFFNLHYSLCIFHFSNLFDYVTYKFTWALCLVLWCYKVHGSSNVKYKLKVLYKDMVKILLFERTCSDKGFMIYWFVLGPFWSCPD